MVGNAILALALPRINGMQISVPAGIDAHCGIPLAAARNGEYEVVVDPFIGGQPLQTITLLVNGLPLDFFTYKPGEENSPVTLKVHQSQLREGRNLLRYKVTNGSQNVGESEDLKAWFHRNGPGGVDQQPGDGYHSELQITVEDAAKYGIGPELAERGVWFYVYSPVMRAFDTVLFTSGNATLNRPVSEEEALITSPDNPLPIQVSKADLESAGQGPAIPFFFTITDWIGNSPMPEPYSIELHLRVDTQTPWFDAPILSENPDETGDDRNIIDLNKLKGNPVIGQVHVRSPWVAGDTLQMTCIFTDAKGNEVVMTFNHPVTQVPAFLNIALDYAPFAAAVDGKVLAFYTQLRAGREQKRSYITVATIVGKATPEMLEPPFLVNMPTPVDPLAHPNGGTARIQYPFAQDGDRARLIEVGAPPGAEPYPLVAFNQNKRVNVLLSQAFWLARNGKQVSLRWNLNRDGGKVNESPVATFNVMKIADGDSRLPTPNIAGETGSTLDVTRLLSRDRLNAAQWLPQVIGQTVWGVYEGVNDQGETVSCVEPAGKRIERNEDFEWPIPVTWLKNLRHASNVNVKLMINFLGSPAQSEAVSTPARVYTIQKEILRLSENFNSFAPFVSTEEGEFITPNIKIFIKKTWATHIAWAIEKSEGEYLFPGKVDGNHFTINAAETELQFGRTCSSVSFWYTHIDNDNHTIEAYDDNGQLLSSRILLRNRGVRADQLIFNHDNIFRLVIKPNSEEALMFDNFELVTQ